MQKHALIFYEIFVRSFADSNGDGIGDIKGITSKLDYLQNLGIEGVWLTPIFESPSYHKYDCTNYLKIDPEYGTEADLVELINEGKKRNIRIVLDLVLNHSSSSHFWFREASKNPNSMYRDFYFWLRLEEIRRKKIGQRRATDDSGVKYPWHWSDNDHEEKYYGMFWKEMPDLNYNSEKLRAEVISIAKYWLRLGIAGFRLDAAKHLFPFWEPESKTHDFWIYFKQELQKEFPEVYLVGEVWDAPEVVAPYYRAFDACFNIDLSYDLKELLHAGFDKKKTLVKLDLTRQLYQRSHKHFIDALILSNHDQERIASTLDGNIDKLKLAANLLFTLPGQPYIYYGEEIGMQGKKPDEHIRESFPWGDETETKWIHSKYNKTMTIADVYKDKQSLLHHYKKLISLRKKTPALYDTAEFIPLDSDQSLLAFICTHKNGSLLIAHNLIEETVVLSSKKGFESVLYTEELIKMNRQGFLIPAYGMLILQKKH